MDWLRKTSVEPIVFLYVLVLFGEYTAVQDLLYNKCCLDFLNRNTNQTHWTECIVDKQNETEDQRIIESQYIDRIIPYNAILAIASIFGSFITGSYGDAFGRIKPLSAPPLLSVVAQILLITSSACIDSDLATVLVLLCAFISGLSGGLAGFLANCFGFISDITNQSQRTSRLVILEANIFCGGFVGYISTGFLLKISNKYKYLVCFTTFLIWHSIILTYIWLRLRAFPSEQSARSQESNPSILEMFADVIRTVFRRRQSNNRKLVFLLIVTFVCVTYGTEVLTSLLFTFVKNPPLSWQTTTYAEYSGVKFGVSGLALCALLLYQRFRPNICDTSIAILGFLSRTCGLILIGFATNSYIMFSSLALLLFSEYPLPAIRSLLSKLVAEDERGRIFAFLTLFHNLGSLSGGILYPYLYKREISSNGFGGLGFEATAVLQIIAILIFM